MIKKEAAIIVIFLVIGLAAIAIMFYSENAGQAWYVREEYRSISYKPTFPPEALYYLQPGKYTTPNYEIKQIKIRPIPYSSSIGGESKGSDWIPSPRKPWEQNILEFNQIRGIFKYIDEFPTYQKADDNSWDLTVNDIFRKGLNENYCGQYGRLLVTLIRNYGIPTKYVQTYFTKWANKQKQNGCWDGTTEGHVYAKVFVDGEWYAIDSTQRKFAYMDNNGNILDDLGNVKAIVFAEGKDAGDTLPYINRWCLEGLRYHTAIPGLLLCPGKKGPDKNQLMMMMACTKPLQAVEWQEKSQK